MAIAFGSCFVASLLLVGLSAGVYAAVVAPMNPPTMEIKLIKEYLALPQLDMRGVASKTPLEDEQNQTNKQNEDENLSSGEGSQNEDQNTQGTGEQQDQGSSQEVYNKNATDSAYAPTWFELVLASVPKVLFVLLLIAAVFGLKLWLRKRRKDKVHMLPQDQQITEVYRFCLKKLEQLKLGKRPEMTPYEFAQSSKPYLQSFVDSAGTDFAYVTDAFVQSAYGKAQLTDEQQQNTLRYYDEFLKCCKNHLGAIGYALRFFIL